MTITPFLVVPLETRRDALRARQRGRRIASILQYTPHEQACIAAGTFVVACQALERFDAAHLCFQIENHQLQVFCESDNSTTESCKRLAEVIADTDAKSLMRLIKPLPSLTGPAEELDLGWLVGRIEETGHETLFEEIVKQNQEILGLLHELRLYQADSKEGGQKAANGHAA